MSGELSLRFSTQAQLDIRRITRDLSDLQRQVASGSAASDLQGFGSASGRLLSARGMKSDADAKMSRISQLQARFGVQSAALGQAADAVRSLSLTVREAISADDGRGIAVEFEASFASLVGALNQSWNGQPLFAGEREGVAPVKISTTDQLLTATTADALFDESARRQTIELVPGPPVSVAPKASELADTLFGVFRDLKTLLGSAGGAIGQPIGQNNTDALMEIVARLDTQATELNTEEGRSGALQKRLEEELVRLQERSDLLTKEIGDKADADLAQVSIRLNSLMAQYEAAAKTFVDLSRLTLLNFLR